MKSAMIKMVQNGVDMELTGVISEKHGAKIGFYGSVSATWYLYSTVRG